MTIFLCILIPMSLLLTLVAPVSSTLQEEFPCASKGAAGWEHLHPISIIQALHGCEQLSRINRISLSLQWLLREGVSGICGKTTKIIE